MTDTPTAAKSKSAKGKFLGLPLVGWAGVAGASAGVWYLYKKYQANAAATAATTAATTPTTTADTGTGTGTTGGSGATGTTTDTGASPLSPQDAQALADQLTTDLQGTISTAITTGITAIGTGTVPPPVTVPAPTTTPLTRAQWFTEAIAAYETVKGAGSAGTALNVINDWLNGTPVNATEAAGLSAVLNKVGVPPGILNVPSIMVRSSAPTTTITHTSTETPPVATPAVATSNSTLAQAQQALANALAAVKKDTKAGDSQGLANAQSAVKKDTAIIAAKKKAAAAPKPAKAPPHQAKAPAKVK